MMSNRLTPMECVELLDNAAGQLPLNRADHAKCQLAVRTLAEVLKDYDRLKNAEIAATSAKLATTEPQELMEEHENRSVKK